MLNSFYNPLCAVALPSADLGRQLYMGEFDMANPRFDEEYSDYVEPVLQLVRAAGYDNGKAFLTVDEKVVKAGCTQRRPGPHVDGCFNGAYWGHNPPQWNHYCNHVPIARMPVIIASNFPACKAWAGEFDGIPKNDGDLSHLDLGEGELLPADVGYLLSPDCVHESLPMKIDTPRTFIRIALPSGS